MDPLLNLSLQVEKLAISHFKPSLCGADEQCLAFLFTVLRITKENLEGRDACDISYVPENGVTFKFCCLLLWLPKRIF